MSKNTGIIAFLSGLAVGSGAGLFLNSQEGKKFRKQAKKRITELEATLEEKVNSAYNNIKNKVGDTAENAKGRVNDVRDNAKSKVDQTANRVNDAASRVKESTN